MNKLAYILIAVSCTIIGCTSGVDTNVTSDSIISTPVDSTKLALTCGQSDTLGIVYGKIEGNDTRIKLNNSEFPIDLEAYIKGMSIAVTSDADNLSYFEGLKHGTQIVRQLKMLDNGDIKINRELLLNILERYLNSDSISTEETGFVIDQQNKLLNRAYDKIRAKDSI